jgi:hypothetical protein
MSHRRKLERWWQQVPEIQLERWVMGWAQLAAQVLKKRSMKERPPWIEMEWRQGRLPKWPFH